MTASPLPVGTVGVAGSAGRSGVAGGWLQRLALLVAILIAAWSLTWLTGLARTVVSISDETLRAALSNPVVVFRMKDGEAILDGANVNRTLRLDEMPRDMALLLTATEDRRFHEHGAIDLRGIARAVVVNLTDLGVSEGASTLTMQLAKTSLSGSSRSLSRKLVEMALAVRIERAYTKKEILALYLSRVEFGRVRGIPVYGLRDAAAVYFETVPADLSTAECAILVAMLNGTSLYDPLRNPEGVADRAKRVIARAVPGLSDPPSRDEIVQALPRHVSARPLRDRYLEDQVLREVDALALDLPDGLYRAVTSIDPVAQWQARRVVQAQLSVASPPVEGATAALLTLDREGRVLAMLGGIDYLASSANAAMSGQRALGSTARLATYLAALSADEASDADRPGGDATGSAETGRGPTPSTADGESSLDPCFRDRSDACTLRLAQATGEARVLEMARALGIAGPQDSGHAVALGHVERSVAETVAAYAALSNGGQVVPPRTLLALLGPQGHVVFDAAPPARGPVADDSALAGMHSLLSPCIEEPFDGACIADAGTADSEGRADPRGGSWFIGITPDGITTGVWIGPPSDPEVESVVAVAAPREIFAHYDRAMQDRFAAHADGEALPRHDRREPF